MDSRENDIVTHMRRIVLACATALLYNMAALAADYRHASIVIAPGASKPQQKAAQMLAEEIEKRTQLRLKILPQAPPEGPTFVLRRANGASGPADGFTFAASASGARPTAVVEGNDDRGVVFGTGYLLRSLRMGRQRLEL